MVVETVVEKVVYVKMWKKIWLLAVETHGDARHAGRWYLSMISIINDINDGDGWRLRGRLDGEKPKPARRCEYMNSLELTSVIKILPACSKPYIEMKVR